MIVSDEENKIKDVIKNVQIKEPYLIDQTNKKKQTSHGTAANYISICADDETVSEIITLSSSGEEDIVLKSSKSKRYSKKVHKSQTKQNKKLESNKGNMGSKKDDLIHPKYKLYEMNKLSPQRIIQKKPSPISTINLLDDEGDKICNNDAECFVQYKKTPEKCVLKNRKLDLSPESRNDIDSLLDFSVEKHISSKTVEHVSLDIDKKKTSDIENLVHDMIEFIDFNNGNKAQIGWNTFSTNKYNLKSSKLIAQEKNNLKPTDSAKDLSSQNSLKFKDFQKTVKNQECKKDTLQDNVGPKPQGLVDFIRNINSLEQKNKASVSTVENKMQEDLTESQMDASIEEDKTSMESHGNCDTDDPQNKYLFKNIDVLK